MHQLARFIGDQSGAIIETAGQLAATHGSARDEARLTARLGELAAALDAGETAHAVFETAITSQGQARRLDGADVRSVVSDYQILRRAILDVYTRPGAQPELPDLLAISEVVDRGIAAWIDYFASQRDQVRDTLAVMGDGLRGPLEAISASTRMLMRTPGADSELVGQISADVLSSTQRMTEVIDGMFDYARAHLGHGVALDVRHVDLATVVKVTVAELAASRRDRLIELQEPPTDADFGVVADRIRVQQAVKNLVHNAVENYADPIVLACVDEGRAIRVDVTSAGTVAADIAEQVFKPYAPSAIRTGPGLGLFLVAEIARAHGGSAWLTAHERQVQVSFRIAKQQEPS
jgi:signal transduction histidine kinase